MRAENPTRVTFPGIEDMNGDPDTNLENSRHLVAIVRDGKFPRITEAATAVLLGIMALIYAVT